MASDKGEAIGCLNVGLVDSALEDHLDFEKCRSKRRLLASCLGGGFNENRVSKRMERDHIWSNGELQKIAAYLGLKVADIIDHELTAQVLARNAGEAKASVPKRLQDRALKNAEMREVYRRLGAGSFVSVFSSDGFIEREDHYFFDMVAEAVNEGLELLYFFPDGPSGDQSAEDYEILNQRFQARLGDRSYRVKAFYLDSSHPICGRASSFVVIGKTVGGGMSKSENVYHFVNAEGGIWFPLTAEERDQFVAELAAAIDPVPYVCTSLFAQDWKLPPTIQNVYRTAFSTGAGAYEKIRGVVETQASAKRIAEHIDLHFSPGRQSFSRQRRVLSWLDIGAEDGANTQVIFEELRRYGFHVALTGIDSSLQLGQISQALSHSPFFNGPDWTFERYDEVMDSDVKFDVITALHAWYLIDPIYLLKAYRRLKPNGILIVTLGPLNAGDWSDDKRSKVLRGGGFKPKAEEKRAHEFGHNFINRMVCVADGHMAAHRGEKPTQYLLKSASEDGFRNFAEDLYAVSNELFGDEEGDFEFKIVNRIVPADTVLTSKGLSRLGKDIVDFFLHGYPVADRAALHRAAFAELAAIKAGNMLPATEIDFIFQKRLGSPDRRHRAPQPNPR